MLIGIICLLVFLFTVYQLSKDDFLFLRRGITVDEVFDTVFLGLPVIFVAARLGYILFNPSWKYLNPLVFFILPYFPGLSLIGGIIGGWLFILLYTKRRKVPSQRLLDMMTLAFLFALSIGILLQGALLIPQNKVFAIEEAIRGIIGLAAYIILFMQFVKGKWIEGSMALFIIMIISLLTLLPLGFSWVIYHTISYISLGLTACVFLLAFVLFMKRQRFISRILGK